jgi:hypothetical protein
MDIIFIIGRKKSYLVLLSPTLKTEIIEISN